MMILDRLKTSTVHKQNINIITVKKNFFCFLTISTYNVVGKVHLLVSFI